MQLTVGVAARPVERRNVRALSHGVFRAYVHSGTTAAGLQTVDATVPSRTHRFQVLGVGLPLKAQGEMEVVSPSFTRQIL